MVRETFPAVAEQTRLYTRILDEAGGQPVNFRTLDVGGDKVLPYWNSDEEENPAMGWRAIRIGLDRLAMLRQQLRALLRAASGRQLHVMFPLVSDVAEFEAAKGLLEKEIVELGRQDLPLPEKDSVGVMLEVPALIWQLPAILKRVDFPSVGSNDQVQFRYATDRENPRSGRRYDLLSPLCWTCLDI